MKYNAGAGTAPASTNGVLSTPKNYFFSSKLPTRRDDINKIKHQWASTCIASLSALYLRNVLCFIFEKLLTTTPYIIEITGRF